MVKAEACQVSGSEKYRGSLRTYMDNVFLIIIWGREKGNSLSMPLIFMKHHRQMAFLWIIL
jgi:uncharacterized protein with NAD-binding domain and iron-sulfur cluster